MITKKLTNHAGAGMDPLVSQVNLENVLHKLMLPEASEGGGWTAQQCTEGEREYKRFLTLVRLFPDEVFVPTRLMDDIWHRHILDTAAYRKDCNTLFGCFLDHYPYYGLNGQDDKASLDSDFEKTKLYYKAVFREELDREAISTRCGTDHACHAETSCACRVSTACKTH